MIQNISIERLEEIEQERVEVMSSSSFQAWVKELKVGRMAKKHTDQASEMMSLWTDKYGNKNTFNYLIKTK